MSNTQTKDKVIFRKFPEGDIIAYFPEIPSDGAGKFCQSYQHIGQHGGASPSLSITKAASPAEYASLKAELESLGYVLEIRTRWSQAMDKARLSHWHRMDASL